MKKLLTKKLLTLLLLIPLALMALAGCSNEYILNEKTFFKVMTNMLYFPENYVGKTIEVDLFMYSLSDVYGNEYNCAVRKCSAGVGCTCGNDTVIGFIIEYDGYLPEARNQSEDSNDKAWVHFKGQLKSSEMTNVTINSYDSDGNVVEGAYETVSFLVFVVEEATEIEDYSDLAYYVIN